MFSIFIIATPLQQKAYFLFLANRKQWSAETEGNMKQSEEMENGLLCITFKCLAP